MLFFLLDLINIFIVFNILFFLSMDFSSFQYYQWLPAHSQPFHLQHFSIHSFKIFSFLSIFNFKSAFSTITSFLLSLFTFLIRILIISTRFLFLLSNPPSYQFLQALVVIIIIIILNLFIIKFILAVTLVDRKVHNTHLNRRSNKIRDPIVYGYCMGHCIQVDAVYA